MSDDPRKWFEKFQAGAAERDAERREERKIELLHRLVEAVETIAEAIKTSERHPK